MGAGCGTVPTPPALYLSPPSPPRQAKSKIDVFKQAVAFY